MSKQPEIVVEIPKYSFLKGILIGIVIGIILFIALITCIAKHEENKNEGRTNTRKERIVVDVYPTSSQADTFGHGERAPPYRRRADERHDMGYYDNLGRFHPFTVASNQPPPPPRFH
ncbi:hypothetical protein G210_3499 [Candida maltosa Xu316]|uniref:Uncharacterized protein n=1 Tax=Candida maltosa (strain Xu316) TaxID=1245528 RepID=M3JTR9_CANMX|nr:hypothetical protein G210_3499 [Candida maltosa Xu316]